MSVFCIIFSNNSKKRTRVWVFLTPISPVFSFPLLLSPLTHLGLSPPITSLQHFDFCSFISDSDSGSVYVHILGALPPTGSSPLLFLHHYPSFFLEYSILSTSALLVFPFLSFYRNATHFAHFSLHRTVETDLHVYLQNLALEVQMWVLLLPYTIHGHTCTYTQISSSVHDW